MPLKTRQPPVLHAGSGGGLIYSKNYTGFVELIAACHAEIVPLTVPAMKMVPERGIEPPTY
jgi:hypothetical protein